MSSSCCRFEKDLNRVMDTIITAVFTLIVILTILLVILRYVFNTGITGGNEMMEYLFVYATALGAAVEVGRNNHIKIGFFVENRTPLIDRISGLISIAAIALINIVFMMLSHRWIAKVGCSESPVMRIPMWLVQISVPIGCLLSLTYCVFNAVRIFKPGKKES